jgi:hypothetical protein
MPAMDHNFSEICDQENVTQGWGIHKEGAEGVMLVWSSIREGCTPLPLLTLRLGEYRTTKSARSANWPYINDINPSASPWIRFKGMAPQ